MELCDQYLHDYIKLSPTANDFFKFKEYEHLRHIQPNYFSEKYEDKLIDLGKKYLGILKKKEVKTKYDKLLERDLTYDTKYSKFKIFEYMPLNPKSNFFFNIVSTIKGDFYFRMENTNDIKIYIERLKKLDSITETVIEKFRQGIKKKVTMYEKNLKLLVQTFIDILKNKHYEFKKNISGKKLFNEAIDKYYVKNINKILIFLISEYYPHCSKKLGICQYPGGKEYYRSIVKSRTMDCATPENLFELGKFELKKYQTLRKKLVGKNEKSFLKKIKKDYTNKQKMKKLNDLTDILYKNIDNYFHKNLKRSEIYKIKAAPPETNSTAYYYPSDYNREKKGTFYINFKKDFDFNELLTLSLHEGLPGHHYQMERSIKDKNLPDYLKYFDNDSYIEGWGLYSENLFDYTDKGEYYYSLNYQILRSSRLILDTGIHYYGWSYDNCVEFIKKNISSTKYNEIIRYISIPGQALTYKVGEQTFLFLRDEYLKAYPGKIKDFHELIIELGPLPLDILIQEFKKKYI